MSDSIPSESLLYLDDIVVYSKIFEEHMDCLKRILARLRAHGLELKHGKCNLFCHEVKYLGPVISYKGISTTLDKVRTVKDRSVPTPVKELRRFLELS